MKTFIIDTLVTVATFTCLGVAIDNIYKKKEPFITAFYIIWAIVGIVYIIKILF